MSRFGDLKKGASDSAAAADSKEADNFIQAAKVDGRNAKPKSSVRTKTWKSVTYSLDEDVMQDVTRLSLLPSGFRASKSDVIRAAVKLLSSQGNEAVIQHLKALKDEE